MTTVRDNRVFNQEVRQDLTCRGTLTVPNLVSQVAVVDVLTGADITTESLEGDVAANTLTADQVTALGVTADTVTVDNLDLENPLSALTVTDTATANTTTTTDLTVTNLTINNTWTFGTPVVVNPVVLSVTDVTASGVTVVPWPADAVLAQVEATGGGGGGGGPGSNNDAGGGGGSSGYARFWVTPTQIQTYTGLSIDIGTGGAGGTGTNDGVTGNPTTVTLDGGVPLLVCTCPGGLGGLDGNSYGRGGAAAAAPTLVSVLGYSTAGRYGFRGRDSGNTLSKYPGGNGGISVFGSGGRGSYDFAGGNAIAGTFGAGGGAGHTSNFTFQGAAGGAGRCIVTWFGRYS